MHKRICKLFGISNYQYIPEEQTQELCSVYKVSVLILCVICS